MRLFFSFFLLFLSFQAHTKSVTLDFYSEKITLEYNPTMLQKGEVRLGYANTYTGKLQIQEYYEKLRREGGYLILLNELRRVKEEYNLNDWLFYQLCKQSVDEIGRDKNQFHRILLRWFLLNVSGFDCRITYMNDRAYLNVFTDDKLFEIPLIEDNGKYFANITADEYRGNSKNNLYIVNYVANPAGRSFNFALEKLPAFKPMSKQKRMDFTVEEETYSIDLIYDEMPVRVMKDYPYLSDEKYFAVPLSNTGRETLIPAFREILKDKTEWEALQILASFTRNAFNYKRDEDYFGRSRPMIPEELFAYPYSDCEDRCALFFALTKELLDLPLIVLSFNDHISMGVATTDEQLGDVIRYQGREYYVCDPTGPSNSSKIGYFPKGYKNKKFEIITQYK